MNISTGAIARKTPISVHSLTRPSETHALAVRYILARYEVSPSLAQTIATLAMLGGVA